MRLDTVFWGTVSLVVVLNSVMVLSTQLSRNVSEVNFHLNHLICLLNMTHDIMAYED